MIIEPVQGEGGFIPLPGGLPAPAAGALRPPRHPLDRRRGPGRRRPHRPDVGDRALRRAARPARVRQVARRRPAAVRGHRRAPRSWTPSAPAASAARSAATRSPAPRPTSCSTRSSGCRPQSEALGVKLRTALEAIDNPVIGEVRGLGPMLAIELTDPQRAAQAVVKARAEGLLLLTCGLHGQCHPPAAAAHDHRRRAHARPRHSRACPELTGRSGGRTSAYLRSHESSEDRRGAVVREPQGSAARAGRLQAATPAAPRLVRFPPPPLT